MRGTKEKGGEYKSRGATNGAKQEPRSRRARRTACDGTEKFTKEADKNHAGTLYRKILAKATVDRTPRMSRSKAMNKEVVVG